MQNKLLAFIRQYDMIRPGDEVCCAVSGGADSVALLFAMYLLKDKLEIRLSAAHFNHHLRGAESDRDEAFVRQLCDRYDIPLFVDGGDVKTGKKGLEAAAREARYAFFATLPGKIATAHTADDNAETVLMHLIRGTGLKGLGGIMPVNGKVIRPMLGLQRREIEEFLAEWNLCCICDSSNDTDDFLRNRLRHHVIPLLKQENPRLAENVSTMAQRLRQDAEYLDRAAEGNTLEVEKLKQLHPAIRSRVLESFLKEWGLREPESVHIRQVEALLFSEKPSARVKLPGGLVVGRSYGRLEQLEDRPALENQVLTCPGTVELDGLRILCAEATELKNGPDVFTVVPRGSMVLRARSSGDTITLPGGTKSLKKLYIDRKIPAAQRLLLPVIADEAGVLGVYSIGVNRARMAESLPAVQIRFEIT